MKHQRQVRFSPYILLTALISVLLVSGSHQEVFAQSQGDVSLTVQAGFNGVCKDNHWFPVRITVENKGADLNARVQVSADDVRGGQLVYASDISLPNTSRKELFLYVSPAGLGTKLTASVMDLVIERDTYYRAESVPNDAGSFNSHDYEVDESLRLRDMLGSPQEWGDIYEKYSHKAEFHELSPDEFFVMGDNSPRSQDSRLWPNHRQAKNRHAVSRQALIGKAFFIYWPHGVPFLNNGKGFNLIGHRPVPRPIQEGNRYDLELAEQEEADAWKYPEYSVPFYPQWWRWKRIR